MSNFKVSKKFADDFEKVFGSSYYGCKPDEKEEMKQAVRRDPEAAQIAFAKLAKQVEVLG